MFPPQSFVNAVRRGLNMILVTKLSFYFYLEKFSVIFFNFIRIISHEKQRSKRTDNIFEIKMND